MFQFRIRMHISTYIFEGLNIFQLLLIDLLYIVYIQRFLENII